MEDPGDHGKSKRNRVVEKAGLNDVLLKDPRFQAPDLETKKAILAGLGLTNEKSFGPKSFDAIMTSKPLEIIDDKNVHKFISEIILIEMKTTKKAIKDSSLAGFFFGATEREYDLAAKLGERFRFAFVVLNTNNLYNKPFAVLLSLKELEARTGSKRIQFQVKLWSKKTAKGQNFNSETIL